MINTSYLPVSPKKPVAWHSSMNTRAWYLAARSHILLKKCHSFIFIYTYLYISRKTHFNTKITSNQIPALKFYLNVRCQQTTTVMENWNIQNTFETRTACWTPECSLLEWGDCTVHAEDAVRGDEPLLAGLGLLKLLLQHWEHTNQSDTCHNTNIKRI